MARDKKVERKDVLESFSAELIWLDTVVTRLPAKLDAADVLPVDEKL